MGPLALAANQNLGWAIYFRYRSQAPLMCSRVFQEIDGAHTNTYKFPKVT